MAEMLTRQLQDNRVVRETGVFDLNVSLGAALGEVFDQPMMGSLAASNIQLGQEAGESLYRLDLDLEQRLLDVQDRALDMPHGPERDALYAEATEITRQMRQGGTERGRQLAIEQGLVLSQEELNERYADYGLQFNRPMTETEAALLAETKRAEIIRETIISAAPQGVFPAFAKFGVGVLAMATDPLELATMFIPVMGQAGRAWASTRFGRIGGPAFAGAVEGFAGSALTEPLYSTLSRQMQLDYDMSDSLLNIGLGTVLGGGLGSVSGLLTRRPTAASPTPVDVPDVGRVEVPAVERVDTAVPASAEQRIEQIEATAAQRPAAETALRQFLNDNPINVGELARSLGMEQEIRSLTSQIRKMKAAPVVDLVKRLGRVDPDGYIATELRHAGITPRTNLSLFRRGGRDFIDNIVTSEAEDILPGITQRVGESNGYLDQDQLIQALIEEVQGSSRFTERADLEEARDIAQRYQDDILRIVDHAESNNFMIRTADELEQIANMVTEGASVEDAIRSMGVRRAEEYAAEMAQNGRMDNLSDRAASEFADELQEVRPIDESVSEWREIMADMELTEAQRADMDEVARNKEYAASYAEAAKAAALCLVRSE